MHMSPPCISTAVLKKLTEMAIYYAKGDQNMESQNTWAFGTAVSGVLKKTLLERSLHYNPR